MNMYLISYSHQITMYQDLQSPLNDNLQHFCFQRFQASGELILPKDRYLPSLLSLRTWPQFLEQKGTQNLTNSGLCPYFSALPHVTILPLLFMLLCATITDRHYLQYLSCWKTKPSEKPTHWRSSLPAPNATRWCFLLDLKKRSEESPSTPFDFSRGAGHLLTTSKNQVSYNQFGTPFAGHWNSAGNVSWYLTTSSEPWPLNGPLSTSVQWGGQEWVLWLTPIFWWAWKQAAGQVTNWKFKQEMWFFWGCRLLNTSLIQFWTNY